MTDETEVAEQRVGKALTAEDVRRIVREEVGIVLDMIASPDASEDWRAWQESVSVADIRVAASKFADRK